jgi:biopolymer transport protein ExbD
MLVHDRPPDRMRADLQIQRAFIITLLGFFTTLLVIFAAITPIFRSGVWPLINSIETNGGTKAPASEEDLFISVTASGELFLGERKTSPRELTQALAAVARPRVKRGYTYEVTVFVRVDRDAPFGAVRAVVRAAQEAKRARLTFLATPRVVEFNVNAMWE